MTRATIIVRIGKRLIRMKGIRDPDGLIVSDSRGLVHSRNLMRRTRADFQERIKPQPFSPHQPFRTPYKASGQA